MSAAPLFTCFDEAPRDDAGGVETATLLGRGQSDGRCEVLEIRCATGKVVDAVGATNGHRYIQVLEGDWDVVIGGEHHACGEGATLVAPGGMACGGLVSGATRGRLLVLSFPV